MLHTQLNNCKNVLLPRDATHGAVMPQYVVCPSVCPSVTLRCFFHTGWNTLKIISRPNSLRHLLTVTPTWAIWCNGNTPSVAPFLMWSQSSVFHQRSGS